VHDALPPSPASIPDEQRLSLRCLRIVDMLYARGFHQLNVASPCKLPRTGPAILICNHISGLDPVLIQSVTPRLIVWMMAREYYDQPGLKRFFPLVKAIPVGRRGRDLAATRMALRALQSGNILGVFPEGRIEEDDRLLPFQTGVAMMAMKTGVDVHPAYLEGTQRGKTMLHSYFESQRANLIFGPPIEFGSENRAKMGLESATNVLEQAVAGLRQRLANSGLGRNKS
jgi:1-acyl-sn-glycerol-3-phosphate acyltransferase